MKGKVEKKVKIPVLPERRVLKTIQCDDKHCGNYCYGLRESGFSTMRGRTFHCTLFDRALEKNSRRKHNANLRCKPCLDNEMSVRADTHALVTIAEIVLGSEMPSDFLEVIEHQACGTLGVEIGETLEGWKVRTGYDPNA